MFSLQRVLGRDDDFCQLFEASAREAVAAVESLKHVLNSSEEEPSLEAFAAARRRGKAITAQISDLLIQALVTSLERSDIEAIAEAIYRIPKTVEKFAERYSISYRQVRDFDFTRQFVLMDESVRGALELVEAFRAGAGPAEIKRLDARVQRLESEADDVIIELVEQLYLPGCPTIQGIIVKDLLELNEKVVDRCRDVSNVIARVVLKNS